MTKRGTQPKQRQRRLKHRAPHGSPEFSKRVAAWVTPRQRKAFETRGGSSWLRDLIQAAIEQTVRDL